MWNLNSFLEIIENIRKKMPSTKILLGGPEIATEYVQNSHFDKYAIDYCISGEGELTFLELLLHLDISAMSSSSINSCCKHFVKIMSYYYHYTDFNHQQ